MINKPDFTGWQYYLGLKGEKVGITIVHANGSQESRSLQDPEVAAWLEAGNTPLPADTGA